MNKKDLDALKELYSSVYDEEQLNEDLGQEAQGVRKAIQSGKSIGLAGNNFGQNVGSLTLNSAETKKSGRKTLAITPNKSDYGKDSNTINKSDVYGNKRTIGGETYYRAELKNKDVFVSGNPKNSSLASPIAGKGPQGNQVGSPARPTPATTPVATRPAAGSGSTPLQRPAASGNVVSAKNIAGQQQKVTVGRQYAATLGGNKGTVSYDASGKRTFNKPPDAPMRKEPLWDSGTPKPSSPTPAASAPKPPTPAVGMLGKTSFERRTPTAAELSGAQGAPAGSTPEQRLQAAQKKTFGAPTTGPTPAIPDLKSVSADLTRANPSATPSQIAGASQGIKPINKDKPIKEMSSYQWPSAKTIRDIAGAYSSIYEAKKKVDQDEDGDNDFADVRVARMIASGVPKAKAIAMVKDKSYNEEVELWVNELLEEGCDLSEYTWDDMFDIYLNEGIGSAIRGLFSKKEAEAPKPQSRGDQLRARYNVGPEKSDTSAKRQILNRAKGNAERAQNQVDMGNASQSYANTAKDAHNKYLKAGYSKYGADAPYQGRGNKARKRAAAMTPREIKEAYETYEFVASYLLENNFASTVDDANVIINNMSEGWFAQIIEG